MKRSLFIAIVVLLMAALFVSCNAEKSMEDQLGMVSISGTSRTLSASAELTVDAENLCWFYTAVKADNSIFVTGATGTTKTPVKAGAGLAGANLGKFSTGAWTFCFYGYEATKVTDGVIAEGAKPVYYQENMAVTVAKNVSAYLTVTLTQGEGMAKPKVAISGATWKYELAGDGKALTLKVYDGEYDATNNDENLLASIDATTVAGTATFSTAADFELTAGDHTLYFYVYYPANENQLVGQTPLQLSAKAGLKYTITDLQGAASGIEVLNDEGAIYISGSYNPDSEVSTATGTIDVSSEVETVVQAGVAPVATEQTTVTFPANSFATEGTHELTIAVADATTAAETNFVVTDTSVDVSGAPIAVLSFTLTDAPETFGKAVEVETYIQKDLDPNSIKVIYNGNGAQPTDVAYDSTTGKLTFKTTHFSDYVVVSTAAVARIGNTLYEKLSDAVLDVPNNGVETTIVLLQDAEGCGIGLFNSQYPSAIATNKSIVIDLCEHTYTLTGGAVGSTGTESQAWHLEKGNTVTIKNGTLTSTATAGVSMLVQNYCDLTLDGVTLDGTHLSGSGCYVLSGNNGDIVITGKTNIIAKAGDYAFDVCYTNYYPDGVRYLFDENYTGTVTGTIQFDVWGTKPATLKCGLTIKAGTFDGDIEIQNALKNDNLGINITGGKINGVESPVALIANGAAYATLKDAITAASEGSVIIVLRDVDNAEGLSVAEGKNFTVDFNGHSYIVNKPGAGSAGTETAAFQLLKDSTIVFKNGVIRISSDNLVPATVGKNIMRVIQNYANLTLDGMEIYAENQYGGEAYVLSFNNGNVVLKNGTKVITTSADTIAFDSYNYVPYYPEVSVTIEDGVTVNGKIEIGGGVANTLKIGSQANVGGVVVGSGYTLNNAIESGYAVYTISNN